MERIPVLALARKLDLLLWEWCRRFSFRLAAGRLWWPDWYFDLSRYSRRPLSPCFHWTSFRSEFSWSQVGSRAELGQSWHKSRHSADNDFRTFSARFWRFLVKKRSQTRKIRNLHFITQLRMRLTFSLEVQQPEVPFEAVWGAHRDLR